MNFTEWMSKVRETVGTTATKAKETSVKVIDTTKLNCEIGSEETELKKKYEKIGQMVYEAKVGDAELSDEINTLCDDITLSLEKIDELKAKLRKMKNKLVCPNCGEEIAADSTFCRHCGEKIG